MPATQSWSQFDDSEFHAMDCSGARACAQKFHGSRKLPAFLECGGMSPL